MDKEAVVHTHKGVLLSHNSNEFKSVVVRWMKLKPLIHSKVSQSEKQVTYVNAYIYIWNLEKWYW